MSHKVRKNRAKERGGGVGILIKSTNTPKPLPSREFHSFECNMASIPLKNKKSMLLISVYRLQFVPVAEFINEFSELLEIYAVLNDDFVIAGDVNIHVETEESSSCKFKDLMDLFDLKQHVVGPTHIMGHTIDVIITPNKNHFVSDIIVSQFELSHHFLIDFKVTAEANRNLTKLIKFRNLKNIDALVFDTEVTAKFQVNPVTNSVDEIVENYNAVITEVLNKHAPIKTKEIKVVTTAPWFDGEYITLRKQRRKAEKKHRKSGLQVHKEEYVNLRKQTTDVAKNKKKTYVTRKLAQGSSKTLYSVVNELIDNKKEVVLPFSESDKELADSFLHHIKQEIDKIRSNFPVASPNVEIANPNPTFNFYLLSNQQQ